MSDLSDSYAYYLYNAMQNVERESRAKWLLPGFDPKKHKIILQGENKMTENEGLSGSITTTTPGPMRYAGGVIPSVGIGLVTPTNHQVKIDKVANGFIVEIGCKKFVAEDWKSLAIKLGEYWKDPVAAEKKYAK